MIACTAIDRARNTRMHLPSISRPNAARKNSRSPRGPTRISVSSCRRAKLSERRCLGAPQNQGGAERSEIHFSGRIAARKYSWRRHWKEKWHDRRSVRQLGGSSAGQWEYVGAVVPTYSRRPWRSRRGIRKFPNLFNAEKPQTPANGAYLFRPSASQSSDRDAQVGLFEIEGLARRHARFGGAVSRPSRSAARPALSAWPAWHPPRPARSSSAQGTAWPAPGSAPRPCRRPRRAWRTSVPTD